MGLEGLLGGGMEGRLPIMIRPALATISSTCSILPIPSFHLVRRRLPDARSREQPQGVNDEWSGLR
jgi:hypothetical protein